VYVDTMYSPYSVASDTRHNFVFGDDGRFHVAGDYGKVLGVNRDGYLYLCPDPDNLALLNGVFEYDGRYLVHLEDKKYLTTGLSSFIPFVDRSNRGERSQWQLLRPDRQRAVLPPFNLHTFRTSTAGSGPQLHAFCQDPDNALPQSATRFVTATPGCPSCSNFLDYVSKYVTADLRDAANWLHSNNAAWLFKDGFYAVSEEPGGLEVSRLDGTPVWRAENLNANLSKAKFMRLAASLSSNFQVPDETWRRVQQREKRIASALKQLSLLRTTM
jgi:hypothetical protein